MTTEATETPATIKEAFAALIEAQDELASIMEWLAETHPHETERILQLREEIPSLKEKVIGAIRDHGKSVDYLDYKITVVNSTKLEVDETELMERARERGDMDKLFEFGFIKYSVDPKQLERLPGALRAVYGTFIEKKAQTPRVTLPKELKEL